MQGAGTTTSNATIRTVDRGDANGRPVWKIEISGVVTAAGETSPGYLSAMWLYVDAENGAVTIFAGLRASARRVPHDRHPRPAIRLKPRLQG